MPVVSLDQVAAPARVRVVKVADGRRTRQLLAQLSIRVGSQLEVQRAAPLAGPILVGSAGSVVAVSRGLAGKVIVEVLA
ncbi:MAG: ferrous iron transport protein A [Acidobacteria bacterium]|nr:ferrous iron transport protein A [Acidobacteriota bacterium]